MVILSGVMVEAYPKPRIRGRTLMGFAGTLNPALLPALKSLKQEHRDWVNLA